MENMEKLLKDSDLQVPQVGDIVTGTVISSSKSEVRIDINGIMTGVIRGRELYFEASEYSGLKTGDTIEATVVDLENENGELELSFRQAGEEKAWLTLTEAMNDKAIIKVKITDANRGGLLASYRQLPGFLPVSQLSPENYPRISGGDKNKIFDKLKSLVGRELEVKIATIDRKEGKLIFSEKDAWQDKQKSIIAKYKIGDTLDCEITAITHFGLFVSFDENLEGLIHVSELGWQRVENPADKYQIGDHIKAQIISIDNAKIFLSVKKLMEDPWYEIDQKYKVGQVVEGMISKISPFGLIVEVTKGIQGLVHISQINLTTGQKISELFHPGDKCQLTIASLDVAERRLTLAIADGKEVAAEAETSDEKPAKVKKVAKEKVEKKVKKTTKKE